MSVILFIKCSIGFLVISYGCALLIVIILCVDGGDLVIENAGTGARGRVEPS